MLSEEELRLGYDLCSIMAKGSPDEVERARKSPGVNAALNVLLYNCYSESQCSSKAIFNSLHCAFQLGAYVSLSIRDSNNLIEKDNNLDEKE